MRNCYLWSNVVFEKEVISHLILKDFRPERLQPFIMQMKANKFVQQWCFFLHHSLATSMTNWESKFHRFVILCLGYTKWEYWSLTIIKGVQCLFKSTTHTCSWTHVPVHVYIYIRKFVPNQLTYMIRTAKSIQSSLNFILTINFFKEKRTNYGNLVLIQGPFCCVAFLAT